MKKLVLLVLLSWPLSLFAEGGGLPDKPYIYVEGKAEIEQPADMVTLRFDMVARNPDQAKANQEVQAKTNKIFALFTERKIAEADVIASDLKSEPQFENGEESGRKRGKIIGHSVTRSFSAKIRDVGAFANLVDELLAVSGLEFSGITSGLAKEKDMQDEMEKKALIKARDQAEKTLKEIGMKIDSVFAVSPVAFTRIQYGIFASSAPTADYESALPAGSLTASKYRLPPITVSQSIHVIYLISPTK
jgi:uncharacterized protein YggE